MYIYKSGLKEEANGLGLDVITRGSDGALAVGAG